MAMMKWGHLPTMNGLQQRINQMFEEMTRHEGEEAVGMFDFKPPVDTYETEDAIFVEMELPGVPKTGIDIDVQNNTLTVRGRRDPDAAATNSPHFRQERVYGTFFRSFTLPGSVNPDKIQASLQDGLLKIRIPKPEAEKPKQISIA